jgi:hypothetical protein
MGRTRNPRLTRYVENARGLGVRIGIMGVVLGKSSVDDDVNGGGGSEIDEVGERNEFKSDWNNDESK